MSILLENKTWEDVLSYPQRVNNVSKKQIIEVMSKYFNDNYLIVRSDKGDNEKVKLEKPPFKPVSPKNSEAKSKYAEKLDMIKPNDIKPRFVDFGKDVIIEDIRENVHFYYVNNPINTIFSMNVQFGLGTIENASLSQASQFISLIGTKEKTFDQFKGELQKLGSKIEVYSNSDYFGYSLSGFDSNFEMTLYLLNEFMTGMHVRKEDEKKLEKLIESAKITRDREIKDPSISGRALRDYVMYGQNSPYLRRSTVKQIEKMTPEYLLEQAKKAMVYEVDIFYTGKIPKKNVLNHINSSLDLPKDLIESKSPINFDYKTHTRNKIFMIDDSKAVQSQIYFIAEGKILDIEQRSVADVFNKYFGRGMASIIWQEIREFRSLAYTAYGSYINRTDKEMKGYYIGYIGTQVDKTLEAISTYVGLFQNMPKKDNRLKSIKSGMTQSINTRKPGWRSQARYVSNLVKQGYDEDPNINDYKVYKDVDFNDILEFYNNNIKKEPIVITILTDKSKINFDKILDFGEVIEIKKENIFN